MNDLMSGKTKDAIAKAHKSVESVMKLVIGTSEHHTFGKLLDELIKSKVIPEYYDNFLRNFEQLVLGIGKERNLPGRGHGQGRHTIKVPDYLAELTVNLAGSINVFLIKQWRETSKEKDTLEDWEPEDMV